MSENEQQRIYGGLLPVLAVLKDLNVPHYVGGSIASSIHGLPRTTMDADVIADLQMDHAAILVRRLGQAYYADEQSIKDAVLRRDSFNFIHYDSAVKVDVFIPKRRPFDQSAMARSRNQPINRNTPELQIPLASPEDTILKKFEWYRMGDETSERQWTDILNVFKVQNESASVLDDAYMDKWAGELGVADLLGRARKTFRRTS